MYSRPSLFNQSNQPPQCLKLKLQADPVFVFLCVRAVCVCVCKAGQRTGSADDPPVCQQKAAGSTLLPPRTHRR